MCSTNIVLEVCVCVHDIWIGIGRFSIPTCTDETTVTVLMREGQAKLIMLRKANCSDLILYGWMDVHDPCLLLVYAAIFSNIIDQVPMYSKWHRAGNRWMLLYTIWLN